MVDEFLRVCQDSGVSVDPSQHIVISFYKQRARQSRSETHRAVPEVAGERPQERALAMAREHRLGDAVQRLPFEDMSGVNEGRSGGEMPENVAPDVGTGAATEPGLVIRKKPGCYIRILRVMASDCQKLLRGRTTVWLRGQVVKFAKPTYKPAICVVEEDLEALKQSEELVPSPEQLRDMAIAPPRQPHELLALLPPPPPSSEPSLAAVAAPLATQAARSRRRQPRQASSAPVDKTPAHPYNAGALRRPAVAAAVVPPPAHPYNAPSDDGLLPDRPSPAKARALYDFDSAPYNTNPSSAVYLSLCPGDIVYVSCVPEFDEGWVKVSKLGRRADASFLRGWVPRDYIELL